MTVCARTSARSPVKPQRRDLPIRALLAQIQTVPGAAEAPILGDLSNGSYNNVTELGRWFAGHTIRPWLVRWEKCITRALFSTADFRLLRAALTSHARQTEDREELARINALHHRRGTYVSSDS